MQHKKHSRVAPAVSTRNLSPQEKRDFVMDRMKQLSQDDQVLFIAYLDALISGDTEKEQRMRAEAIKGAGGEA